MQFKTSSPPYLAPAKDVPYVMGHVLLALLPATLAYVWFFGFGIVYNMLVATATAVGCEAATLHLRGKAVRDTLMDGSAVVTAVLLAFALPPITPWWVTAIGAGFAIVFAKQLFGGLGFNPFNPAMAGYVVVLVSFPTEMTAWLPPRLAELSDFAPGPLDTLVGTLTGRLPDGVTWDSVTMATPLDHVRTGMAQMYTMNEIRAGAVFGTFGGRGWEWIGNFTALGGFWLLYKGIIRWHIPVGVLAGLMGSAVIFYGIDPGHFTSPTFHLFGGAAILGAFFIATDPVSAATSPRGRIMFGLGIGILTYVIRAWGGYPDGIAFAVLLMNMAVPAIDHFTRPRVFGQARRHD